MSNQTPTGVSTGLVAEADAAPPELERLNAFIGRWMTEGETVATADAPALPIVASDVYQWVAGGRFVMHPAYGRIGDVGVGGLEVIGYDPGTGQFRTWFFDSQGNTSQQSLSLRNGRWIWEDEHVRCTSEVEDGGKTMIARHERSADGINWEPSMTVTLRRVD